MKKSEIFENFVKISEEKGLLSSDKSFKTLEQNPRADSLSVKDIEKLYSVKPDSPKDMEYDRNIMEVAHPSSVVTSPAYDRINGLVENNNERQAILLKLVNKRNDGLLLQRKLAHKDFILSLVRIANHLDNTNNNELREFADSCLKQVEVKKNFNLNKKAAFPWLWVIAGGIAAVAAGYYISVHTRDFDVDFPTNHTNLIEKIDKILGSESKWHGFGYEVVGVFRENLKKLKQYVMDFKTFYDEVQSTIAPLKEARSKKENVELAKNPEFTNKISALYSQGHEKFEDIMPLITAIQKDCSNLEFKGQYVKLDSLLSKVKKPQFLWGNFGIVPDDFNDLENAIAPYIIGLQRFINTLSESRFYQKISEERARTELTQAAQEFKNDPGSRPSQPSTSSPYLGQTTAPVGQPNPQASMTDRARSMIPSLTGNSPVAGVPSVPPSPYLTSR